MDNGTYTVRDETTTATATFAAADRATPSGYLDVYSKQSGTVSDELKLFGNIRPGGPQTGAPLQLTYLSYGIWSHNDSQTGERRKAYLLFGYPTGSSMPVSGSATYQTAVTGNMLEAGVGYVATESEIGGSATFTANFGTGAISTDLALYRASNQSALGTFNGTGTITADQFSGTYTSNAQFFSGGFFHGGFFGPSATEMGYNFSINKNNPDPYAGATIAPMNTLIIGSVVGKKN